MTDVNDPGAAGSAATPVRLAMVGGGPGAFIGPVHRMAAELDRRMVLVAGAFSADAVRSREAGTAYGLWPDRVYDDYRAMMAAEAARPDGAEAVAIVTPNDLHLPVARAALEAGLHVISDKPATRTLAEAQALRALVEQSGRLYGLTYTYTGYPMLRAARGVVARGELGPVRKVVVEYSQGWLSRSLDLAGDKQASWRMDPEASGAGGCSGDIGVHAFQAAEFVSGIRVERVCADLSASPGRTLDDDCNVLLRFAGDVPGVLIASQVASGDRNGLRVRVYGERGGLDWSHESPDRLTLNWLDAPTQILHAASGYLDAGSRMASRLPVGHPEGFIEAFANIYREFAAAIRSGASLSPAPDIREGVRGMAFVDAAVRSSRDAARWTRIEE